MKRKLKNTRGETLVEALASILIGALSVALLFTAVMASVNMDRTAKKADEDFNAALGMAEMQEPGTEINGSAIVPSGARVTVENTDPSITGTANPEVNFYGGDGAISYALNTTP